jgi:hypothetical protein
MVGHEQAVRSMPYFVHRCGKFVALHGAPYETKCENANPYEIEGGSAGEGGSAVTGDLLGVGLDEPGCEYKHGRERDGSWAQYLNSGWCRAEMLAARCPVGLPLSEEVENSSKYSIDRSSRNKDKKKSSDSAPDFWRWIELLRLDYDHLGSDAAVRRISEEDLKLSTAATSSSPQAPLDPLKGGFVSRRMWRSLVGGAHTLDREYRRLAPLILALIDSAADAVEAIEPSGQKRREGSVEGAFSASISTAITPIEMDELRRSIARLMRVLYVTTPVPSSEGGGVERGGTVDGGKRGVFFQRCEDGRQFERWYAEDARIAQGKEKPVTRPPRLMAAWEHLPVSFFAQ